MRTYVISIIMLGMTFILEAQSPLAFNYQGVAANQVGELLSDQTIQLQISLLEDGADGRVLYTEIHEAATDAFGHYMIPIGKGEVVEGDFASLDWSGISIWYQIDIASGDVFTTVTSLPLLSVPIANYAISAKSGQPGIQGPTGPQGAQGPKGPIGPAGPQCPANPIGPQGEPGPQGAQGASGEEGPAGFSSLELRSSPPEEGYVLLIYLDDGTNRQDGQIGLRYLDDGVWVDVD